MIRLHFLKTEFLREFENKKKEKKRKKPKQQGENKDKSVHIRLARKKGK